MCLMTLLSGLDLSLLLDCLIGRGFGVILLFLLTLYTSVMADGSFFLTIEWLNFENWYVTWGPVEC